MERNKKHIEADQLLQALSARDLTLSEWERLDVLAREDAFLADAVDGLKSLPPGIRRKHLLSLRERLGTRRDGVRLPAMWLRLAGAAAIVAIVAGMIWLLPEAGTHKDAMIMQKESPAIVDGTLASDQPAFSQAEPEQAESGEAAIPPPAGSARNAITEAQSQKQPMERTMAPGRSEPASPPVIDGVPIPETRHRADDDAVSDPTGLIAKAEEADRVELPMKPALPLVQGVVLDAGGRPLTGAQVQVKGTSMQSSTDMSGNFAVAVPETQLSNALVISHGGYRTVEADVVEGDSLVVRLPSELAGQDISVLTYAAPKRRSSVPGSRALARPSGGERNYEKYIRENLKYPASAADHDIHGTVILEFDLNTDGTPTDFRVLQSLGYGCDEEAIRLVRDGPKWNVGSAQVPVGRWEVKF